MGKILTIEVKNEVTSKKNYCSKHRITVVNYNAERLEERSTIATNKNF